MKNASLTDLLTFCILNWSVNFLPPSPPTPPTVSSNSAPWLKGRTLPVIPRSAFSPQGPAGKASTPQGRLSRWAGREERSLFFVNLRPALHLRTGIYQMGWKCQPHLPSPYVSSGAFESFYRPLRWGWRSWEWSGGRMVKGTIDGQHRNVPTVPSLCAPPALHSPVPSWSGAQSPEGPQALRSFRW